MSRIATLFVCFLMLVSLTACNTMRGAGQDLENAGESVQDAAEG
ncbi:entericidin A/B family lipoprotein [Maricaulaceae bacterium MS644]